MATCCGRQAPRRLVLLTLVSLGSVAPPIHAGAGPEAAYRIERQRASELFARGERLQALPLLEELVRADPQDDAMLAALAACLVDHAATLSDPAAAGQERLRARELLDRALELGNSSALAMNLWQLLRQLPASGAIGFSDNPQVNEVMRAAEAAFSRRDFAAALRNYLKALELEPTNYSAALFIANTYDRQSEFGKGAHWYERAIQLNPDVETSYRYYADMLAREGDMSKARSLLIHAAVAEPYNRIVWRELRAWATLNKTRINEVYIGVPVARPHEQSAVLPDVSSLWRTYHGVRARWQTGGEFARRFPAEKQYRHSLAEEFEALAAVARVLRKSAARREIAAWVTSDPDLGLLLKLYDAGLLESYVLFSLGDDGIARDYPAYRLHNRPRLEEYLDKFVVPPPS